MHDPPSPLRSPDNCEAQGEDREAGLEGELEVGSMVEVNDPPLYGVIRWVGRISGISAQVAGIELVRLRRAGSSNFFKFKNTSHVCEKLIILSSIFSFYL